MLPIAIAIPIANSSTEVCCFVRVGPWRVWALHLCVWDGSSPFGRNYINKYIVFANAKVFSLSQKHLQNTIDDFRRTY